MKYYILIFLLPVLSCNSTQKKREKEIKEIPEVFIQKVVKQELYESLAFSGLVEPSNQVGLFSQRPGLISKVFVNLGEKVKKNQRIMLVTPKDQINYRPFYLSAPIDGYLISLDKKHGDFLNENEKAACIAKLDHFQTTINASLLDLKHLSLGTHLDLILAESSEPKEIIKGTIFEISPIADLITGTFKVKLKIHCSQRSSCFDQLKAGTYLRAYYKKNKRLGIKLAQRFLHNEKTEVYTIDSDDKAHKTKVTTGYDYGDTVEVLSGIKEGDTIITTYSRPIEEGISVKILKKI